MSLLYERSIIKLELDRVLALLAQCASSQMGKQACLDLKPNMDIDDVEYLLSETAVAAEMATTKGYPAFSGIADVSESMERVGKGGTLNTAELLRIAGVLRCARAVKAYGDNPENPTILDSSFAQLKANKYLEERIFSAILSEDEIADSASPELADIRRHMRIQSGKAKECLQKIISSSAYAKYLREPIVTIRQGRYVVPVKSECKNEIPGLVHDVSATGSTHFIEPMAAVSANNALRELEIRETKEIERILAQLSAEVSAHCEDISANITILVSLDVIFAKAKLAYRMKAVQPIMNDQGVISLKNARHPLIDADKVVPVSLRLGSDFDSMIITGPNTGGKTVTLKTVGLLTLMAECGLHIPANDGSTLSTFDLVLADIGDEQSIAQNLSTFSSHMRTISEIVSLCNDRTLVLFDELGSGTDPAEGAALAVALIEHCRKTGCRVVATTHYAELKLYAIRTEGVINASCEFDVETLQPTYKLLIGIPGKSNAFAISRKLGISEQILESAGNLLSQNDRNFEDVLSKLEMQRHEMEQARRVAERLRQETEQIKNQSEAYKEQLEQEKRRVLEEAREQAKEIIADARRTAIAAADEIKAIKKQLTESADLQGINQRQSELRRKLNEAEETIQANQIKTERPKPSRDILVGDTVELLKLGTKANVVAIKKDGTLELQAGVLKLNAKREEVYLLENENVYKEKPRRPAHSGKQLNLSATASEIDLRGMDSVEAICVLERYLDEAMRSRISPVRIIHGKGTGVLRKAVQQSLKANKFVKSYRLGLYGEGEDGVTIVEF